MPADGEHDLSELASHTRQTAAAPLPVTVAATPTAPSHPRLRMAIIIATFIIGLSLLGWAVYGAMLLRGDTALEGKENVESMAKLMLYLAGPLGAALVFGGVAMVVMRRH